MLCMRFSGIGIAEQDAVLALRHAGRNLHLELALDAFAAIGAQEDLDRNLRRRPDFGRRHPGVLDGGDAALRQQIHRRVHALQLRRLDGIAGTDD